MKRLLLLRHAKAEPATNPLADSARPLAERGKKDAQRIGERLQRHGPRPTLILSSPAARALQTARLVAAAGDYPHDAIALEPGLYLAEPGALVAIIAAQSSAVENLLVVGHNPGLTELVHRLLPTFDDDDLPTGAVVGLDYPTVDEWAGVTAATPTLAYYDFPKNRAAPVTAR